MTTAIIPAASWGWVNHADRSAGWGADLGSTAAPVALPSPSPSLGDVIDTGVVLIKGYVLYQILKPEIEATIAYRLGRPEFEQPMVKRLIDTKDSFTGTGLLAVLAHLQEYGPATVGDLWKGNRKASEVVLGLGGRVLKNLFGGNEEGGEEEDEADPDAEMVAYVMQFNDGLEEVNRLTPFDGFTLGDFRPAGYDGLARTPQYVLDTWIEDAERILHTTQDAVDDRRLAGEVRARVNGAITRAGQGLFRLRQLGAELRHRGRLAMNRPTTNSVGRAFVREQNRVTSRENLEYSVQESYRLVDQAMTNIVGDLQSRALSASTLAVVKAGASDSRPTPPLQSVAATVEELHSRFFSFAVEVGRLQLLLGDADDNVDEDQVAALGRALRLWEINLFWWEKLQSPADASGVYVGDVVVPAFRPRQWSRNPLGLPTDGELDEAEDSSNMTDPLGTSPVGRLYAQHLQRSLRLGQESGLFDVTVECLETVNTILRLPTGQNIPVERNSLTVESWFSVQKAAIQRVYRWAQIEQKLSDIDRVRLMLWVNQQLASLDTLFHNRFEQLKLRLDASLRQVSKGVGGGLDVFRDDLLGRANMVDAFYPGFDQTTTEDNAQTTRQYLSQTVDARLVGPQKEMVAVCHQWWASLKETMARACRWVTVLAFALVNAASEATLQVAVSMVQGFVAVVSVFGVVAKVVVKAAQWARLAASLLSPRDRKVFLSDKQIRVTQPSWVSRALSASWAWGSSGRKKRHSPLRTVGKRQERVEDQIPLLLLLYASSALL